MKIGVRHCEAALIRLLVKHLCVYHSAKSDCRTHFEDKQQSIENIRVIVLGRHLNHTGPNL